ncbi:MAG: SPOR domain-containing protein [Porticoccaceae bacterium]
MARDYAKPAAAKKPQVKNQRLPMGPRTPPWAIFVSGAIVGVAATLAAMLWRPHPGDPAEASGDTDTKAQAEAKPRFDFYTLLKESEVFVPEVEEPPLVKAPAPPTDPAKKKQEDEKASAEKPSSYEFILQTGSFRTRGDADSLRARLLLLNLRASVESAGAKPGEVWHRVMVGPFTSQETLARARTALQQNGVDSILVKRKSN